MPGGYPDCEGDGRTLTPIGTKLSTDPEFSDEEWPMGSFLIILHANASTEASLLPTSAYVL